MGPLVSAAVLVVLSVGGTPLGRPASAGDRHSDMASRASTVGTRTVRVTASDAPLTVVSESPWVAPGQNFDLRLRIGGRCRPVDLGLTVNVYPCLSSVSAFDQSLSISTLSSDTPISSTPSPLPVSGLPAWRAWRRRPAPCRWWSARPDGSAAPGGSTIDLSPAGDECGAYPTGVYPVWVQLVDLASANRHIVSQFTTHLIYTNGGSDTQRLQVALVLPIDLPVLPSRSPSPSALLSRPGAALAPPSNAAVSGINATLGVLDTSPSSTVPVTVDASPLTVQLLHQSGHPSTVAALAAVAGNPSVHQFLSAPFAPVNVAGLVDAGLGSELTMQVTSRGDRPRVQPLPIRPPRRRPPTSAPGSPMTPSTPPPSVNWRTRDTARLSSPRPASPRHRPMARRPNLSCCPPNTVIR